MCCRSNNGEGVKRPIDQGGRRGEEAVFEVLMFGVEERCTVSRGGFYRARQEPWV
jgi:hypothetical protein